MKKYIVKEEYLSNWGTEMTTETVIDQNEVERLAKEWEIDVNELLDQLNEIEE